MLIGWGWRSLEPGTNPRPSTRSGRTRSRWSSGVMAGRGAGAGSAGHRGDPRRRRHGRDARAADHAGGSALGGVGRTRGCWSSPSTGSRARDAAWLLTPRVGVDRRLGFAGRRASSRRRRPWMPYGMGIAGSGDPLQPWSRPARGDAISPGIAVGVGPGPVHRARVGLATAPDHGPTPGIEVAGACSLDILARQLRWRCRCPRDGCPAQGDLPGVVRRSGRGRQPLPAGGPGVDSRPSSHMRRPGCR